jgi:hypothetical protein
MHIVYNPVTCRLHRTVYVGSCMARLFLQEDGKNSEMSVELAFLLTIIASFCGLWLTLCLVSELQWPTKGRGGRGQPKLTVSGQSNLEGSINGSLPEEV